MAYPPITALPPAPQRNTAPETFIATADTFVAALATLRAEANALATWEQSTAAQVTSNAATAAAAAATVVNAPGTSATSSTSLAIGLGSKTLTIQTNKAFAVGQPVIIANTTAPENYMTGQVTAHNSGAGALTVAATATGGSGTFSAWTISLTAIVTDNTPIGTINAWLPGYFTAAANSGYVNALASANTVAAANAYLNPRGWYVCDGAAVNVAGALVFNAAGRYLPNLTDNRFLMGGAVAGVVGGNNSAAHSHTAPAHTHTLSAHTHTGPSHTHTLSAHTHAGPSHTHTLSAHTHAGPSHTHTLANHTHTIGLSHNPGGLETDPYRDGGRLLGNLTTSAPSVANTGASGTAATGGPSVANTGAGGTAATGAPSVANTGAGGTAATGAPSVANTGAGGNTATGGPSVADTGSGGAVATGGASATENRPSYLSCFYIIKVL